MVTTDLPQKKSWMPRQNRLNVMKSSNSTMIAKVPPRSNRSVVQNLHQADHTGTHHQSVQTPKAGQHIAKTNQFPPDQRQHLIVLEGYRQGRCNVPETGIQILILQDYGLIAYSSASE